MEDPADIHQVGARCCEQKIHTTIIRELTVTATTANENSASVVKLRSLRSQLNDISQILRLGLPPWSCILSASPSKARMSQPPPLPSRHSGLDGRNRRLSIIQDTAADDLDRTDTHALDETSPSPHHESSMMSYMTARSPKGESSYACSPPSPLISRDNSVVAVEKPETNGKVVWDLYQKLLRGFWLKRLRSS